MWLTRLKIPANYLTDSLIRVDELAMRSARSFHDSFASHVNGGERRHGWIRPTMHVEDYRQSAALALEYVGQVVCYELWRLAPPTPLLWLRYLATTLHDLVFEIRHHEKPERHHKVRGQYYEGT